MSDPTIREKISTSLMGHPVSEETRKKMSAKAKGRTPANKGKPMSQKQKDDLSGRICINDGVHNKYIHKNDTIPSGWKIGLFRKNQFQNKKCITNEIQTKWIPENEPVPNGWRLGAKSNPRTKAL